MIIQALRKGLIEREASDTGGVPRWKSSCPDRLAEATGFSYMVRRYPVKAVKTVNWCLAVCQGVQTLSTDIFGTGCVYY